MKTGIDIDEIWFEKERCNEVYYSGFVSETLSQEYTYKVTRCCRNNSEISRRKNYRSKKRRIFFENRRTRGIHIVKKGKTFLSWFIEDERNRITRGSKTGRGKLNRPRVLFGENFFLFRRGVWHEYVINVAR